MTEGDFDSKNDEIERDNLQATISAVETAIAVSTPGTRPLLQHFLQNAQSRVFALEKKIKDSETARENYSREQAAIVASLVEKESGLNAKEKETYGGVLKKEFFTKRDFAKLDEFYSHSWERLSEGGKDQMSHRIWTGIRRGEYRFEELPASVREKEAARLHQQLKAGAAVWLNQAPDSDRKAFVEAMDEHRNPDAEAILNRAGKAAAAGAHHDAKLMLAKADTSGERSEAKPEIKATVDLSGINLNGIQLVNAGSISIQKTAEMPSDKSVASVKGKVSPGS